MKTLTLKCNSGIDSITLKRVNKQQIAASFKLQIAGLNYLLFSEDQADLLIKWLQDYKAELLLKGE